MATIPKTGQARRAGIIVEEAKVQRSLIRDAITLNLDGEKAGVLRVLADILERTEAMEHQAETMVRMSEEAREKFNVDAANRAAEPRLDAPVNRPIAGATLRPQSGDC